MTITTNATRHEVERITSDLNMDSIIESSHGMSVVRVRGDRDLHDLAVELDREGFRVMAGRPRALGAPRGYASASSFIRRS